MTDAELQALAQAVGLAESVDDAVAWARARTEQILLEGLDADLAGLLEGRPVADRAPTPAAAPRAEARNGRGRPTVDTVRGPAPTPTPIEARIAADADRGSSARLPLPPLPQRPDLAAARPGDSADDLEMLDEEDLELMEEVAEDGDAAPSPEVSSPEWKRALADAQSD